MPILHSAPFPSFCPIGGRPGGGADPADQPGLEREGGWGGQESGYCALLPARAHPGEHPQLRAIPTWTDAGARGPEGASAQPGGLGERRERTVRRLRPPGGDRTAGEGRWQQGALSHSHTDIHICYMHNTHNTPHIHYKYTLHTYTHDVHIIYTHKPCRHLHT